mmetsp:Transcript_42444/g.51728  ORF Transcript_42444/g.51728 Transcript_42444/m.51728 type:complete len:221 (-) Transcript_42444:557-1219(-)
MGNNSTIAHKHSMRAIRIDSDVISIDKVNVPVRLSQSAKPMEVIVDAIINATVPATDLSGLNDHLLFAPNRRPIKSAIPSPAAIVLIATIPTKLLRHHASTAVKSTITYTKGPCNASLASPLLDTALASSDSSPPFPVPAMYNLTPFNSATIAAKNLAPSPFEKSGQTNTNKGAAKVWTILRESRGLSQLPWDVHNFTKTPASTTANTVAASSLRMTSAV